MPFDLAGASSEVLFFKPLMRLMWATPEVVALWQGLREHVSNIPSCCQMIEFILVDDGSKVTLQRATV